MVEIVKNRQLIVLFALVFIVNKAHAQEKENSIQCYTCNSFDDPKCAGTWEYGKQEGPTVKCIGKNAACKKILSYDSPKSGEYVIRECWNTTDAESLPDDFLECKNMMKAGKTCYCNTDYCNGQGHLVASGLAVVMATCMGIFRAFL